MTIFLILHAPQRPKEKGSLSYLSGVWGVDMFFKTGSALPVLVAARVAKGHAFKSRHTGSVSALLVVPYSRAHPYRGALGWES